MGNFKATHHKCMTLSSEASSGNCSSLGPFTCHFRPEVGVSCVVLTSTLRWRCQTSGGRYDKALCCRRSTVGNSQRSLYYESLQPKPAWCLKQLRADVEPMIIFWVGLGSSTSGTSVYGGIL